MRYSLSLLMLLCCAAAWAAEPAAVPAAEPPLAALPAAAPSAKSPFVRPPELEPDVQFWIRVYSEISTNDGFIHDQHDLSVVYETVHFTAAEPQKEREQQVEAARQRYQLILGHLGNGSPPQDAEERRVRALWSKADASRLLQASDDVRFQLGQSDRFRAGLYRAGAWETHIAETLANLGLPAELAALPHVESSFDPSAGSKVGAAGLWQFMRSTGRRFLRIDRAVDERLDPFRSTEAAAQLLAFNYRVLGTWPLAITAYNHGAEGMRRACVQLNTTDIAAIVRNYHSPTFGFASRNFYASFLAALAIAQAPEKYFGALQRSAENQFQELRLTAPVTVGTLRRLAGVPEDQLRALNPALLNPVWSGRQPLPRGYRVRLPADARAISSEQLTTASAAPPPIEATVTHAAAATPGYTVQRGDTLSLIAARTGIKAGELMRLNGLRDTDFIYEGQQLQLAAGRESGNAAPAQLAEQESIEDALAAVPSAQLTTVDLAAVGQAVTLNPSLAPGPPAAVTADATDYSVAADDSIQVAAAETLGHYADWLELSAARLRTLNGLKSRTPLVLGRHLKLDFSRTSHEQFEQRRRSYHQQLEATYFANHRIVGTQIYIARSGDSLWSVTQRGQLPVWLLRQYNPDLNFADLRPGTQIVLPQVEGPGG
ncbi:MAG TPA: LysM peptidoglycan-binding domain-containing protein [Steroidobacteraceae bacterium]|nr:LysM peptidoglycan-binding domain-containing protein [Steroidobacteraceae bacterium]